MSDQDSNPKQTVCMPPRLARVETGVMVLRKRAENSSFGKILAHGKEPKA